jgi:hypothetical protein
MIAPIERSIPPEMITIELPSAKQISGVFAAKKLLRYDTLKKPRVIKILTMVIVKNKTKAGRAVDFRHFPIIPTMLLTPPSPASTPS